MPQKKKSVQETKTSHALTSDFSLLLDDTFCGCNVRATNPRSRRTKEARNRCHICPRARTFLGEPLPAWKVNTEVPHSQGQRAQLNKMENLEKYNYCKGRQDSQFGESSGRSGVIADISSQKRLQFTTVLVPHTQHFWSLEFGVSIFWLWIVRFDFRVLILESGFLIWDPPSNSVLTS